MGIERILGTPSAGPLLGGLSWRPPSGGKHSMRRLFEARDLASDATHYAMLQAGEAVVYGLYQPRASEEALRLPKGVLSAAHCFAHLVGQQAANAALILNVPAGEHRRDEKVYVVVLEDGLPVVDSLTNEMEARNALGSEDRPIWSNRPMSYPDCNEADLEWLASGATKSARVVAIPVNPWPMVVVTLVVVAAGAGWFMVQRAKKAEEERKLAAAAAAADPIPKYLAALAMNTPTMESDRDQMLAVVQEMFSVPVHVPGWGMSKVECEARRQKCVTSWVRQGGTYDDLRRGRPDETLQVLTAQGNPVPQLDVATTLRTIKVGRKSLIDPARPLMEVNEALTISGPLWQVWKTGDLTVEVKPPTLWPEAEGVPKEFTHPSAMRSGELSLSNVPGPFILEALRTAPTWISWETVRAEISDGDVKSRLKFNATGIYYANSH